MKWFKHDTDANQDAKLQNVLLDYGLEGYGLYWYCIELIAGRIDKDNITFELEHDSRILARNTGSTPKRVEEMMHYFIEIGLFEDSHGVITCLKLAKRLDKSMTSNPEMRNLIEEIRTESHDSIMTPSANSHDSIMIKSESIMQDQIRLDQNNKNTCQFASERDERAALKKTKNAQLKYITKYFDVDRIIPIWNGLGCQQHKGLTQKAKTSLCKTYFAYVAEKGERAKDLNDWLEVYLTKGFAEKFMTDHHRDMGDGQWCADLEFAVRFSTYDSVRNKK